MSDEETLNNAHKLILELASQLKPVIENPLEIKSQELALNLQILLKAKGPLNSQDAESYRELIIGLNEKLKVLQIQYQEIEFHRKLSADLASQIRSAELSNKKIQEELQKIQEYQSNQIKSLSKEKSDLINELSETKKNLEKSKLNEEELKFELDSAKNELDLTKEMNSKLLSNPFTANSEELEKYNESFNKLTNALMDSMQKYDEMQDKLQNELLDLEKENEKLQETIKEQVQQINDLKSNQNLLESENESLRSEVTIQENELKALNELDSQNQSLKSYADELKSQNSNYENNLKNLSDENKKLYSELTDTKEKTNFDIQSLNHKLLQQEEKNQLLSNEIKNLENDLSTQQGQNSLLSKRLAMSTQSVKSAFEEISKYQNEMFENQKKTESELEFIANYTLKTSQDHLDKERQLKKLTDILDEKDSELSILREMIGELQKPKPSYFPTKDDVVDQALAEYLNTRPEPMEINFIREDAGTYLFGSKRVFIKIENGKIIIRVGGGFMRIDEFIELYTPLEVEKLDERRKFENSPARKNSLGKLGSIVNEKNKQEISAQKAAKIIQESFVSGKTKFSACLALPRKPSAGPVVGENTPSKKHAKKNSFDRNA